MAEAIGKSRVVILCGNDVRHFNTCASLIRSGVNVVGIVSCNQEKAGVPVNYIFKMISKNGFFLTLSQIVGKVYYSLLNRKKDAQIKKKLFDRDVIMKAIESWRREVYKTSDYNDDTTIKYIESLEPDVLLVHTPYWVGKRVRELSKSGFVIGGHPGITPDYRGAHSAFWAIYNDKPQDVGYSVFLLDRGVDTGAVIQQGRVKIEEGDSFVTLGWKGMIEQARVQAEVLLEFDKTGKIDAKPHDNIRDNTLYDNPGIFQILKYQLKRTGVR
ncbi:MAG: hypothetical protein HWE27_10805 [Gammaproteobacteria bacterium]|nr:hypothetical protein [Gammaproteobacteria bacterium]